MAITLLVKQSSVEGKKISVSVELSESVRDLKEKLVDQSGIPSDQQRLVYKGQVLKDERALESYGLENEHVLHLVRGRATGQPRPFPIHTPAEGCESSPSALWLGRPFATQQSSRHVLGQVCPEAALIWPDTQEQLQRPRPPRTVQQQCQQHPNSGPILLGILIK